jgi:hypothetical protein
MVSCFKNLAACMTENGELIKQCGAHNHQASRNASLEKKNANC